MKVYYYIIRAPVNLPRIYYNVKRLIWLFVAWTWYKWLPRLRAAPSSFPMVFYLSEHDRTVQRRGGKEEEECLSFSPLSLVLSLFLAIFYCTVMALLLSISIISHLIKFYTDKTSRIRYIQVFLFISSKLSLFYHSSKKFYQFFHWYDMFHFPVDCFLRFKEVIWYWVCVLQRIFLRKDLSQIISSSKLIDWKKYFFSDVK